MMDNFLNIDKFNTPCYVIDTKKFKCNCSCVMNAFTNQWGTNIIYGYSVKTNSHSGLMNICSKDLGWYLETVSSKEYSYAITQGCKPKNIILNGPHKQELLISAISSNSIVNLDNLDEINFLCDYIETHDNFKASLENSRIGLRVNFDLEKICPNETTMGTEVSKFGLCYENGDLASAISMLLEKNIKICGLHMHTSTTTRSTKVFQALSEKATELVQQFNLNLSYIDIGGGFFGGKTLPNKPTMSEYAHTICNTLKKVLDPEKVTLIIEPGASIIATSIEYLTKVVNCRSIRNKHIVTVNGTALHINPFLANRTSEYIVIRDNKILQLTNDGQEQIICGSTCMEKDRFFSTHSNPQLEKDDIIIFKDAGAYTMAFNSDFILDKPTIYII